jgi:hypothetical protein
MPTNRKHIILLDLAMMDANSQAEQSETHHSSSPRDDGRLSCSECQDTDQNQVTHSSDNTKPLWQINASSHTWMPCFGALAIEEYESRTVFKILTSI